MCALAAALLGLLAAGGWGLAQTTSGAAPAVPRDAQSTRGALSLAGQAIPGADWPEFDYDPQRSGVGPADTGIEAGDVGLLTLRTVRIGGIVDSSAVELHDVEVDGRVRDVVAVTTTYGDTIAIDPATGRLLWEFRPRGVDSAPGNPQVTTATPAIDPDRAYIYTASPNGVIHKLAIATGRQVWARSVTLDPAHEKLASAINIDGPWVVVATGGYIGDIPPYDGHVVTLSRATGRIVHVFNTMCSDRHRLIAARSCPGTNTNGDDAIWARAGAVVEPGSGRLLVATGNGPFNGRTYWGDSVLELSADAGALLHNWTPTDQARLDAGDIDLGSTAPALVPGPDGMRLAVQGGKDGRLHLLNLSRLDGTTGGASPRLGGELSEIAAPGGAQVFTAPAVLSAAGRTLVFVADGSGTAAYRVVGGSRPRLAFAWQDSTPGTSPVVAGGLLYVYDPSGAIDIRNPLTGALLRSVPAAPGHWNSPIVVGGRIVEPTGAYGSSARFSTIYIYHLPGA
ncbi:MAG TPA: PQQ-binding-like beta-propeller repeat protein [Solirubrobacteraceae bacterium]|nr:PQQ-binding-like beta-propeller repeat protein [Solirubrobacteraceae bacterium]